MEKSSEHKVRVARRNLESAAIRCHGARVKPFFASVLLFVSLAGLASAAETPSVEQQVAAAMKSSGVTVVHFWATWCPNCKAELAKGAWTTFVETNADVNFVFVTAWDAKPGAPVLESFGLGAQKNFMHLQHPNPSKKKDDRLNAMLGLPISWLPTTWVFRDGQLRYALNYGELRFPMLQQMIRDSSDKWEH
jgi:thiol-disulfide isomerase/thioredoxin